MKECLRRLRLGIKTWKYGLACPLGESIRRSAELEFGFIDINFHLILCEGEVYYWPKEIAPDYRCEIKQLLKGLNLEAGLVIPKSPLVTRESLGSVKIEDIAELSDIPEEKAQSLPFRLKLGVDTCRGIGAQILDDIHLPPRGRWKDLDRLKLILRSTDLKGIRIGLENRDDTDPKQLLKALEEVDLRNVGLTFDVGHAYNHTESSDQVAEQIRELSAFIYHTHIHESTGRSSTTFGLGKINWIKIIQAFKSIGYDGPLTFEAEPEDRYILSKPPHPDYEILRYRWIMAYLLKDA